MLSLGQMNARVLRRYWWVGILTVVSVFLLTWRLGNIPRGFDGDEAALGYYGYSLLHYGSDEYGNKWPMYFKSIGDYKYPVYSYLSMIPVAIGGLSVITTRLVSVASGLVMLAVMGKWLWSRNQKSRMAVTLAVLTAWGSGWWLMFSRGAYEANLAMALVSIYIYLAIQEKRGRVWWVGIITLLVLSSLSYSAARIVILAWTGWWLLVGEQKMRTLIVLTGAVLLIGALSLDPNSRARAEGLVITRDAAMWAEGQNQIWEVGAAIPGRVGWLLARVFDNKYLILGRGIATRYLQHFDLSYLFVSGNPRLNEYTIPFAGMLPVAAIPLLLLGVAATVKRWREPWIRATAGWILVAPVAAAMTVETPNPVRTIFMLPPMLVLVGLGATQISALKFKILGRLMIVIMFLNAGYVWKQYFIHREQHQPWFTEQGLPEMVRYVIVNQHNYDQIVMGNTPYIYYLFYGAGKPEWHFSQLKYDPGVIWNSVDSIGKVVFRMNAGCPKLGKMGVLYICKGFEIPINGIVKSVSYHNDGVPAYAAVEFVPLSSVKKRPGLPGRFEYMVESDPKVDGLLPAGDNRLW